MAMLFRPFLNSLKGKVPIKDQLVVSQYCTYKRPDADQSKDGLMSRRKTAVESYHYFENTREKNRQTFRHALEIFKKRDGRRHGTVEFIRVSSREVFFFIKRA